MFLFYQQHSHIEIILILDNFYEKILVEKSALMPDEIEADKKRKEDESSATAVLVLHALCGEISNSIWEIKTVGHVQLSCFILGLIWTF